MSMSFFLFLAINLLFPTAGMEHYPPPDWLVGMTQPALVRMCLDENTAPDKRILAAAELRIRHREKTDFRQLASRIKDPVLRHDLLAAAGDKPGRPPVLDGSGVPVDVLCLPADTKAVLFYSDHFRREDDVPAATGLRLPGPWSSARAAGFFNTQRILHWIRVDSITLGLSGTLYDPTRGAPAITVTGIVRGTFSREKVLGMLGRADSSFRKDSGDPSIWRSGPLRLVIQDDRTLLFTFNSVDGIQDCPVLRATRRVLQKNTRPLTTDPTSLRQAFGERALLTCWAGGPSLIPAEWAQHLDRAGFGSLTLLDSLFVRIRSLSAGSFTVGVTLGSAPAALHLETKIRQQISSLLQTLTALELKAATHKQLLRLPEYRIWLETLRLQADGGTVSLSSGSRCNHEIIVLLALQAGQHELLLRLLDQKQQTGP